MFLTQLFNCGNFDSLTEASPVPPCQSCWLPLSHVGKVTHSNPSGTPLQHNLPFLKFHLPLRKPHPSEIKVQAEKTL